MRCTDLTLLAAAVDFTAPAAILPAQAVTRRAPWLALLAASFVLALSAPLAFAAFAQNYNRYHFDQPQPVPLVLNPDRIAVFAEAQDQVAVEGLAEHGITVTSVEPSPIPGWQLLNIEMEAIDGLALEDALNDIAREGLFDFVSPVFFDDLGGPCIPTRDILVRFNPDIEAARQDQILAEMNVGVVLDRDWANMPGAYRIRSHSNNGFVVLEQANALAVLPEVRWAEPDMIFTGRGTDVPKASGITTDDPGITVLVMDHRVGFLRPRGCHLHTRSNWQRWLWGGRLCLEKTPTSAGPSP
ncbi:hypothetical protein MNBD_PLANCTO03-1515 [hydrothermal vent metagenome]|uniref:Uncharacterized protein n=1 Tax=hydrothermal vent metagenome TaxID=652676 RepID=A0A3B1DX82_9ZZZZ